jgi:hypothetical protein
VSYGLQYFTIADTDLASEHQKIYDSEINIQIGWVWDGGIDVRLGEGIRRYLSEANVRSVSAIVPRLQEAIAYFYPESEYAASLDAEIRTRAARRVWPERAVLVVLVAR